MSTANFLVLASLTKIGKNSPLKAAKAEDILTGISALASLLERLNTQNIIINTSPVDSPNSEVGESADIRNALTNILAVEIATNYDSGQVNVSETLRRNANSGMVFLKKWYNQDMPPTRILSSTAPRGSGNNRFGTRGIAVSGDGRKNF